MFEIQLGIKLRVYFGKLDLSFPIISFYSFFFSPLVTCNHCHVLVPSCHSHAGHTYGCTALFSIVRQPFNSVRRHLDMILDIAGFVMSHGANGYPRSGLPRAGPCLAQLIEISSRLVDGVGLSTGP